MAGLLGACRLHPAGDQQLYGSERMMPHPSQRKRTNSGANAAQMDLIDLIEQMERQDAKAGAKDRAVAMARQLGADGVRYSEAQSSLSGVIGDAHPPQHSPEWLIWRAAWDAYYSALRTASTPSTELQRQALAASERRASHPPVRFRHPATGQTWTGRGLKPRWVIDAIAGGMTLEQLAVQA